MQNENKILVELSALSTSVGYISKQVERMSAGIESVEETCHRVDKELVSLKADIEKVKSDYVDMNQDKKVKGWIKYGIAILVSTLVSYGIVTGVQGQEEKKNEPTKSQGIGLPDIPDQPDR